jgi:hypothetical protein
MSTAIRPHPTFGTEKKNTPGVLGRSQTMYSSISNITMFASLPITMQAFLALITALAVAQQAATGTRAKGTASTRNSKRNAVWAAMVNLQSCVQGLADSMSVTDATTLRRPAENGRGGPSTKWAPAGAPLRRSSRGGASFLPDRPHDRGARRCHERRRRGRAAELEAPGAGLACS